MRKHLISVSDFELQNIVSGKQEYLIKYFKKRIDFITNLQKGELIYLRKMGGEVALQFTAGKIILVEGGEKQDYDFLSFFSKEIKKRDFEEMVQQKNIIVIVQIYKLEQLITSPIDVPKGRKEWVVLED